MVTVDEIIERLNKTRFRPASESEDAFGELRSLAHHEFMGGELWSDWEALIDALPVERGEEAIRYLAQVWGLPPDASSREDVEDEFLSRALVPLYHASRAEGGLEYFEPPASKEAIEAWEREFVPLPVALRRFLLSCSAGIDTESEQVYFCLGMEEGFMMLRDFMTMSFPDDGEYDTWWFERPYEEVAQEREVAFRNALAASMASEGVFIEVDKLTEAPLEQLAPLSEDPASAMLVISSFFEGNHGDNVVAVMLEGPLRGRIFIWSTYYHSGGLGGRASILSMRLGAWLGELIMDWG